MNAKTTGMTEGSIMAAIITVHMTRNGRRAIPWQVGMSALAAVQTQASAARIARLPETGIAMSVTRGRNEPPLCDPAPFRQPPAKRALTAYTGSLGQKKPGGSRLPARMEHGSRAQGTNSALEKALLLPWVTPLSRICALICDPAVMTPAPNAVLALVASAHLPPTTVQQRFAAERIASNDVGPAVHPIGSLLVQPCVVSLMVAARH